MENTTPNTGLQAGGVVGTVLTRPAGFLPSADLIERAKLQSYNFMNPERLSIIKQMAEIFHQSGALPAAIKNAPQIVMIMQAGYEAGLQPIEAVNSFYFVNGKLSMYGDMGITLVRRAGHKIEWIDCSDKSATCKITRGDTGESLSTTFTWDMAVKRNMIKDVWTKFPENMLKYKAFWSTAHFLCPDALHGASSREDLEDISLPEQKEIKPAQRLEATVTTVAPPKPLVEALDDKDEEKKEPAEKPAKPPRYKNKPTKDSKGKEEEEDPADEEEEAPKAAVAEDKKPEEVSEKPVETPAPAPVAEEKPAWTKESALEFISNPENKSRYDHLEVQDLKGKIPFTPEEQDFYSLFEQLRTFAKSK